MSKTNIIFLLIIVAIIAAVAFIAFGTGSGSSRNGTDSVAGQLQSGDELPYTDLDGNPVDLAQFEDGVLVINAWASWCPFCVNELPDMEALGAEFKDQGVKVIAINRAESANTANAFVNHIGNPENIIFLLDPDDTFYKSIGGFSMPETMFYHADGSLSFQKRGFMELEEMRQHVEAALAINEQ